MRSSSTMTVQAVNLYLLFMVVADRMTQLAVAKTPPDSYCQSAIHHYVLCAPGQNHTGWQTSQPARELERRPPHWPALRGRNTALGRRMKRVHRCRPER